MIASQVLLSLQERAGVRGISRFFIGCMTGV
jgi:hypothetical protein